jgi:hypothetical protein
MSQEPEEQKLYEITLEIEVEADTEAEAIAIALAIAKANQINPRKTKFRAKRIFRARAKLD